MTQDEIIDMARQIATQASKVGPYRTWTHEYAMSLIMQLVDASAAKEREHYDDLFERIKNWCEAYPINVFPEQDFGKAHEVLKANGMTLDAISASNMKHVITQVQKMIDAAIRAKGET